MLNGYNIPVTATGVFNNVVWGEPEDNQGSNPMQVAVTVHADGNVRVTVTLHDGGVAWCEQRPCEGDNVLDYVRLALDNDGYTAGANGYYVEWPTDPDGIAGAHRLDDGTPTKPSMVLWRNEKLR